VAALADENCEVVTPTRRENAYGGIDMLAKCTDFFEPPSTTVVFGDVWFSSAAIDKIRDHRTKGWAVFGRSTDSAFGLAPWAEYFAITIHQPSFAKASRCMNRVAQNYLTGKWNRCTPWEWYFCMDDLPWVITNPKRVKTGNHWVEINDLTDDVDFPSDVDRLERAIAKHPKMV